MAYGGVTEENVYLCTGQPQLSDIMNIMTWMLNEDFITAVKRELFVHRLFNQTIEGLRA